MDSAAKCQMILKANEQDNSWSACMTHDPAGYIVNPGPKRSIRGLKAAVTTDFAIVTETMIKDLRLSSLFPDRVLS